MRPRVNGSQIISYCRLQAKHSCPWNNYIWLHFLFAVASHGSLHAANCTFQLNRSFLKAQSLGLLLRRPCVIP